MTEHACVLCGNAVDALDRLHALRDAYATLIEDMTGREEALCREDPSCDCSSLEDERLSLEYESENLDKATYCLTMALGAHFRTAHGLHE